MWESWRQEQDKDKQQYQQEKGGAERKRVQGCTMGTGWSGEEGARKTREKRDGKRKKKNNQTAE